MKYLCIECGKKLIESSFYKKVKNERKGCLNKKLKYQICGKFFTKKWLNTHIEREHQTEATSSVLEKPKIDIVTTNNRTLLVCPGFSGKTYLLFKNFSRIPDRDIHINTKSPTEQYSNSKTKIKEMSIDIKPLNPYENAIIVFDDNFGSSDNSYIDQFFIRGRYNNLDVFYLSQSYFDLPKRTIRNISNKIFLFNQTL